LERLSRELNDAAPGHEFTTWSKELLRGFLSDAIQLIVRVQPAYFVEDVVLTLTACAEYHPICPCSELKPEDVIGQSTADGHVVKTLRYRSDDIRLRWFGKPCKSKAKPFRLKEYSISKDGKGLKVYPPVPPGQNVYLMLRCLITPNDFSDGAEFDDELVPAIVQWCLSQAKFLDAENNAAILAVAKEHENTFWTLLGVTSEPEQSQNRRKE
jgi:hypothetical protein